MTAHDDDIERRVRGALDDLDADYDVLRIDPRWADTAAFCERYGVALEESANAIVVADRRESDLVAVCLALATTRLDVNHRVRRVLGARKLSFATPDRTRALTGMEIGGVTPFGLPAGLRVLVDARVTALDSVVVGGGSRSLKLRVDPQVFSRLPDTVVVEALAREHA